uniref:Uncharacterized protein n=1 Tax=Cacopsylla melanoneura TaxID=428564 RepID=A0A8D9BVZ7_9HEMI
MNLFMLDSLQIWQKKNFFGFFPISFLRFGWFSWSNDPLFFFLFCSGSFRRVLLGSCSESSDSESNPLFFFFFFFVFPPFFFFILFRIRVKCYSYFINFIRLRVPA